MILPACGEVARAQRVTEGAVRQHRALLRPPSTILRMVPLPVPGRN
jgi:hypothetical protein